MADKVEIEISAKDNASKQIQTVDKSLTGLEKSAQAVGTIFKTVLTIEAGKMVYNMAKMGAEAEETQRAFKNFSKSVGVEGNIIVENLQKISKYTMDDEDAMKSIMKTMQLLGGEGVNNLEKLTEVARASSVAFGGSTQDNLDKLTTGIARMSERQLTTMGITVDTTKAYKEYAESIGMTASSLTDGQKRQAFMNAVIEKGSGLIKTYGKEGQTASEMFQAFETKVKDLQENLGRTFLPLLTEVLNTMNQFFDKFKNTSVEEQRAIDNETFMIMQQGFQDKMKLRVQDQMATSGQSAKTIEDNLLAHDNEYKQWNKMSEYYGKMIVDNNLKATRSANPRAKVSTGMSDEEFASFGFTQEDIDMMTAMDNGMESLGLTGVQAFESMLKAEEDFGKTTQDIIMGGVLSSLNLMGQAFYDMASGTENAWAKMGKGMLVTALDVVKQILTAYLSLAVGKALVDGNWGAVAGIGATIVGVSALQASASNISFGGEETASNTSTSSSSSGSQSSSSVSDGGGGSMSSGGQGNLVINLYNPTFMDKSTKERTIDDLLLIAQNYGWNITKNSSVVVA